MVLGQARLLQEQAAGLAALEKQVGMANVSHTRSGVYEISRIGAPVYALTADI